jgi:hypothetical protein
MTLERLAPTGEGAGRNTRGRVCSPKSGIELVRVHPELVFGIQLHVGHWLELRFIEGRKLGFGRAQFLEMFAGVGESVVIGVADFAISGDAVASGQGVSFRGGGDGGIAVALVALDLGEDVDLLRLNLKLAAPALANYLSTDESRR